MGTRLVLLTRNSRVVDATIDGARHLVRARTNILLRCGLHEVLFSNRFAILPSDGTAWRRSENLARLVDIVLARAEVATVVS